MRKTFEFFLILIIFYGVYSAFEKVAPMVFQNPKQIWVILVSLIVAALLLVLYSFVISQEVKTKMKKNLEDLKTELHNKDSIIAEKDSEIKAAQSFKEDLITEAEQSSPQD